MKKSKDGISKRPLILSIVLLGLLVSMGIFASVRAGVVGPWVLSGGDAPLWVPKWVAVFLAPFFGAGIFAIILITRINRIKLVCPFLLLLVLFAQMSIFFIGLNVYNSNNYQGSPYFSQREIVSLGSSTVDWDDPSKPKIFDLGNNIKLVMSTVVFADENKRTLPKSLNAPNIKLIKDESSKQLNELGRSNLIVFTKALGYLRFFTPSDEAASADWNRIAAVGAQQIEDAGTPGELVGRLRVLFGPYAPGAQFLVGGEDPRLLPRPSEARYLVRWRHHGFAQGKGSGWKGSANDRAVRLGDVALAWTTFQHFHPYLDVVGPGWEVELQRALDRAALDRDEHEFLNTLRCLTAGLRDGHVSVRWEKAPLAAWPALGLTILRGRPIVVRGERDASRVPLGSEILTIDGVTAMQRLAVMREEISASTEAWMEARLAAGLLEGPRFSPVRVGINKPNGEFEEITLQRYYEVVDGRPPIDAIKEVQENIWYMDASRINNDVFYSYLPKLKKAKGIICDIRSYPKGFVSSELLPRIAGHNLRSPWWCVPVITQPDRQQWKWDTRGRWFLTRKGPHISGKVVFLSGGGAISYAESCLGIVENYKLGEIVGGQTAGTNGNVTYFELPGGYRVTWTGMRVLKGDKSKHHGVGIHPTVLVHPTMEGISAGRDETIAAAINIILK